jgi:hypothetical protein
LADSAIVAYGYDGWNGGGLVRVKNVAMSIYDVLLSFIPSRRGRGVYDFSPS